MKRLLTFLMLTSFLCWSVPAFSALPVDRRISDDDRTVLDLNDDGSVPTTIEGSVAADSASVDNPIIIGGKAESTIPTEVSDGDVVHLFLDTFGRLVGKAYNFGAGSDDVNIVSPPPVEDYCIHLLDVTVDANGESFNGTMDIGDAKKLSVLVWNVETATADDSEVNVTIELSPDGTALMTAQTAMINSEDLAQAAAADWTFDTTEARFFYFADQVTAKYLKATVTCDADCDGENDNHVFDLWVCVNE